MIHEYAGAFPCYDGTSTSLLLRFYRRDDSPYVVVICAEAGKPLFREIAGIATYADGLLDRIGLLGLSILFIHKDASGFNVVEFEWRDGVASKPRWTATTRQDVEDLCGEGV